MYKWAKRNRFIYFQNKRIHEPIVERSLVPSELEQKQDEQRVEQPQLIYVELL